MKTVILGGGISGLLAAYVFRGPETVLIERNSSVGGHYLGGGLKYIQRTTNMEMLLDHLHIPWQGYIPAGGILWEDKIHKYPQWMRRAENRLEIQKNHWARTRGSLDGFISTCMNDPLGPDVEALRLNHGLLLRLLELTAIGTGVRIIVGTSVTEVTDHTVSTTDKSFQFDRLITTLPLPLSRHIFPHIEIPDAMFKSLTVVRARSLPNFLLERGAAEYDYIYTPEMAVFHRVSRTHDNKWQMEASGIVKEPEAEAKFMSVTFENVAIIPGHLIPVAESIAWPGNILPLGRFAEWDSRSTAEKSLDRLLAWKRGKDG